MRSVGSGASRRCRQPTNSPTPQPSNLIPSQQKSGHTRESAASFACLLLLVELLLPRKEVIQPHLPVLLPCYDFVPVADPTLGRRVPKVRYPTSGVSNSHDVTGGVYKARERIHRTVADLRLLATPTSWGRVADPNPN